MFSIPRRLYSNNNSNGTPGNAECASDLKPLDGLWAVAYDRTEDQTNVFGFWWVLALFILICGATSDEVSRSLTRVIVPVRAPATPSTLK